jgi:glycosyltransferase involved in cell wall biosynthesis
MASNKTLLYSSSYDRGLDILLYMWGDIKKVYPDAELYVCYGWDLFDKVALDNPERVLWKQAVEGLLKQDGIHHMGRLGKKELYEVMSKCGIWAYPTYFTETNCITALEAQSQGCVPVTMSLAALSKSVGSGVKVEGHILDPKVKDVYLKELLSLMGDEKRWKEESEKAREFAKNFTWDNISNEWIEEFEKVDESIKVTVYTPTIRKGFWNIMANNLSIQTYKNFEWVIVDDIDYDRSKIAQEYATKYNLDIRYMKGKKRFAKREYGLINANNTMLKEATGEVIVFLQDFMFIREDGLEQIVNVYKRNKDALIATCDINCNPKIKPDIESEDWFYGELDVIGSLVWKNVRIQNKGLRESTNPFDFEQNYGAIPTYIARELNGWYEFLDDGLGYDNTDIAYRATKLGYRIIIDETNIAVGLNHWDALRNHKENVLGRARKLNDPRYAYLVHQIDMDKLPVIRDAYIDDNTSLQYEIPSDVKDEDIVSWIQSNSLRIVQTWL